MFTRLASSVCLLSSLWIGVLAGCISEDTVPSTQRALWVERSTGTFRPPLQTDVLLIIDNAPSMIGIGKQKQLQSTLRDVVNEMQRRSQINPPCQDIRVGVLTTGLVSDGCPACSGTPTPGCVDLEHENSQFHWRIGKHPVSSEEQQIVFEESPDCAPDGFDLGSCLYDLATQSGRGVVGYQGCAYRRGLSAMRTALERERLSENARFLRKDAQLVVIVISDGEDCGEPGEVAEKLSGVEEKICSYAAKGVGPDGNSFHVLDPEKKPYHLTPVQDYYDFLMLLKDNQPGMVQFGVQGGFSGVGTNATANIEYATFSPDADVLPACSVEGCSGAACTALPGSRYLELARLFQMDGILDSLCASQASNIVETGRIGCPHSFDSPERLVDPALLSVIVNDKPMPRQFCANENQLADQLVGCSGPEDPSCIAECVDSWTFDIGTEPGVTDTLRFNPMIRLCPCAEEGILNLELVYAVEPRL